MKMFRRKDEGFTLVELMVVILIIGILVAIAIPVFNAARATAQLRACHSNQRMIDGAVQQWAAQDPSRVASAATMANLVPTFIAEMPECNTHPGDYTITAGLSMCPGGATGHPRY